MLKAMVETQGFQHPSSIFCPAFSGSLCLQKEASASLSHHTLLCPVSDVHGDITTRELSASDLFPDPPRTEIWRREGGWLLPCCCSQFYNRLTQAIVDGRICLWRPIFYMAEHRKELLSPKAHTELE